MVLEELYDELSEFLVLRSLIDEEIFGSIHMSPVFAVGFSFADSIETHRNRRCYHRVLDRELWFIS